jgi:hypothetical protein
VASWGLVTYPPGFRQRGDRLGRPIALSKVVLARVTLVIASSRCGQALGIV